MTSLELRPLSAALQQKAIAELHENPDRLADDIATLREWVQKQPHLKARTTDQFLVAFLRGSKFSLEKAKQKMDTYYSMRSHFPELFQCYKDEEKTRAVIRQGVGIFLRTPMGEDGPRLCLARIGNYDPEKFTLSDIMQVSLFAQDLNLLNDDNAMVSGLLQMIDCSGFSMTHMMQMNLANMKRMAHYMHKGLPIRTRAIHYFNASAAFETFFATLKPMLPKKIQDRVHVHATMESLYKHVPQRHFPVEYGGENGTIAETLDYSEAEFMRHQDYLREESNYGVDESRRQGQPIDFDAMFGSEGSFRKLDVD